MGERNTFQLLEKMEFQGIDIDLETSLLEYGMIWRETDTEYIFLYDFPFDGNLHLYWCSFNKDTEFDSEFDWIEFDSFLSCFGITKDEFDNMKLPFKIFDTVGYYGVENVFGSEYHEGITDIRKLGYYLK